MWGLLEAKSEINIVRFRHTQFTLPIADAKLNRIANYLSAQIAEIEKQQWEDFDDTPEAA